MGGTVSLVRWVALLIGALAASGVGTWLATTLARRLYGAELVDLPPAKRLVVGAAGLAVLAVAFVAWLVVW